MNITEVELRKLIVKALVANGTKAKDAKLEANAIDVDDLVFEASKLGLSDTEDPFELEETPTLADEVPTTTTINAPKLVTVVGLFGKTRSFESKDADGNPILTEDGEVRMINVIDIHPVNGEVVSVFITPKQITGFGIAQGKYVEVVAEVRRAHITQYETKAHEIKFHGKESDPKGKIEYAFVTGREYMKQKAYFQALMNLPVEERESARLALVAFANLDN